MTDSAERAKRGCVLVLDDEEDVREVLQRGLSRLGFEVHTAGTAEDAVTMLDARPFDAMVLDRRLGESDGLETCQEVVACNPGVPIVVLTGHGSMEAAVGALRAGAYDFVTKPVDIEALALVLSRAVSLRRLHGEVERLRSAAEPQQKPMGERRILGNSSAIERTIRIVERTADSDVSILITGESGTGKELIARELHDRSQRLDHPFVALNCAAIPPNLLESELFGHVRGAFTDARTDKRGLLLEAGEGTLFLDEIGELPMELQPKLLRALQERAVRAVGDSREHPVRARIVTATNRDLEAEVANGRFREDLFYRINVLRIDVPPLASRGADVLLLAQHFLDRISARSGRRIRGLTRDAAAMLLEYPWPGNVRELQNAMERAVALAQHDKLVVGDLPERIRQHGGRRLELPDTLEHMPSLAWMERRYIHRVLDATGGNKTRAAEVLGLDRRTLYRKLERYANSDQALDGGNRKPESGPRGTSEAA